MEFHVSVCFEQKVEAGSHEEAMRRALDRICTASTQPEHVSIYREREEKE